MSKKVTRERILARLSGEALQIQGRIESISRRMESLPSLNRKILILEEETSRMKKSIRKEFKALRRELDSYIDFVKEDAIPQEGKAAEKKEELLGLLEDLKSSLKGKEEFFSSLQEDSPPDIL